MTANVAVFATTWMAESFLSRLHDGAKDIVLRAVALGGQWRKTATFIRLYAGCWFGCARLSDERLGLNEV